MATEWWGVIYFDVRTSLNHSSNTPAKWSEGAKSIGIHTTFSRECHVWLTWLRFVWLLRRADRTHRSSGGHNYTQVLRPLRSIKFIVWNSLLSDCSWISDYTGRSMRGTTLGAATLSCIRYVITGMRSALTTHDFFDLNSSHASKRRSFLFDVL